MKTWLIPHPNVPNTEFGDAHLKRVTMLFNENFAKLDALMQSAQASVSSLESSKSNDGHGHDEDYAQLEHKHVPDDVTGLSDLLANKANLNHEHSQYLTEVTAHQHETNEVNGLLEALNGKAPLVHGHTFADVEGLDDLSANAARTSYVDQRDTEKLAAANAYTDAAISGIHVPEASSLTPYRDKEDGAVGTATSFARGDHQHPLNYPDGKSTTNLQIDGAGQGGVPLFGTTNRYADLGHSHPLNYPETRPSGLIPDGTDAQDEKNFVGRFGDTNCYADLGHSHALNVDVSLDAELPKDVAFNDGTASLGASKYYARADHIHKMPKLLASKVEYGTTTVGAAIAANASDISSIKSKIGETVVNSVAGRSGDVTLSHGDIGDWSLATEDFMTEASLSDYAKKSDFAKDDYDRFTETLSQHAHDASNTIVVISGSNTKTLSDYFTNENKLKATEVQLKTDGGITATEDGLAMGSKASNALAVTDSQGAVSFTSPGDGLKVESGVAKVKCDPNGGLTADDDGVKIGVEGTGFIKIDDGTVSVPTDQPVTLGGSPAGGRLVKTKKKDGVISLVEETVIHDDTFTKKVLIWDSYNSANHEMAVHYETWTFDKYGRVNAIETGPSYDLMCQT